MEKRRGLVISGPTGTGKTEISLKLAKMIKSDIISADASQIYKYMDIGTAKILEEEMQGIRHHMIDFLEPGEYYSAADFVMQANNILKEKEKNQENILVVGGTGLYIKALTDGFSVLPSKDEKLRMELEGKTVSELGEMLNIYDHETYEKIDRNNKPRLVRAVEVCLLTGKKFSKLKMENIKGNSYSFLKIFLTREREELYSRINERVEQMFVKGLLEEAGAIYRNYSGRLHKVQAIGYKELFRYFDGNCTLEEAKESIKRESRRYAKRQITWFRREKDYLSYNLSLQGEQEVIEEIIRKWNIDNN